MGGKDDRIVVIDKENGGVASARNVGIEYAVNHNIDGCMSFVDDDDYLDVNGIEVMVSAMERNDVDVVWANFKTVLPDKPGEYGKGLDYSIYTDEVVYSKEILMSEELRIYYSLLWGKLYKTKLWCNLRLPEHCRAYDDGATTFKVLYNAEKLAMINECVLFYCLSTEGITRNQVTKDMCREALFTQTEKINFYKEKQEKNLIKMAYVGYIKDILDNMVYSAEFDDKNKSFFKEMKRLLRKNVFKAVLAPIPMRDKLRWSVYYIYPELVVKRNKK